MNKIPKYLVSLRMHAITILRQSAVAGWQCCDVGGYGNPRKSSLVVPKIPSCLALIEADVSH